MSKFTEIFLNKEVRRWMAYKVLNPKSKSFGKEEMCELPEYMDKFKRAQFNSFSCKLDLPLLLPLTYSENKSEFSYELANGSLIKINRGNIKDLFDVYRSPALKMEDSENTASIYRLSGLLKHLERDQTYGPIEEQVIKEWMTSVCSDRLAWESYTIAERISNIGLFLCRTQCHKRWDDRFRLIFFNKIIREAKHIFDNLEYFGEIVTCNHYSNNGRGLVWAGFLTGHKYLLKVGLKIMEKEFSRLFNKEGEFLEGSLHYWCLVLRNYFEALWISKERGNLDFENSLIEKLKLSTSVLKKLIVNEDIPTIGDLSPDFKREWLSQIPYYFDTQEKNGHLSKAKGWMSSFFENIYIPNNEGAHSGREFFSIKKGDYTALTHVNSFGWPKYASHSHCDSFSPVVYFKGTPFLIDPGKKDYLESSKVFAGQYAHNGLIIDGLPNEILARAIYGSSYMNKRCQEGFQVCSEENALKGSYFVKSKIEVKRELILDDGLILKFSLFGKGKCQIDIPFYINEAVPYEVIGVESFIIKRKFRRLVKTWAQDYGKECNVDSFVLSKKVQLPFHCTILLKPLIS
tara:strand:+ start:826 stop:2544 length:1719 start_codon:yes stop_codon:yes gene_type:complete